MSLEPIHAKLMSALSLTPSIRDLIHKQIDLYPNYARFFRSFRSKFDVKEWPALHETFLPFIFSMPYRETNELQQLENVFAETISQITKDPNGNFLFVPPVVQDIVGPKLRQMDTLIEDFIRNCGDNTEFIESAKKYMGGLQQFMYQTYQIQPNPSIIFQ